MAQTVSEISALLKEQIKKYSQKLETTSVGKVISVGDGIALVYGLDDAMYGELLDFGNDIYGMAFNLSKDNVGTIIFGNADEVKEGDTVKCTKRILEVPVGDKLLGRVIDPLGRALDGLGEIKSKTFRPVEKKAMGVMARKSVNTPLQTGIKVIDALVPIGRGQRELIIGDRQTGKTSVALDTIINQKGKNVICIYVAIGQKDSTVSGFVETLKQFDCMSYSIIVNASASNAAPLLYLAPYSGVTIGEEFMYQGKDVLIVYDDLSKHAVAYREMSLLLKRPPGREAYPGDVFYLHSRLLERAARLNDELGGGSITALPIVETQAGDISSYIPTNIISITDGQIFLQSDLFHAGVRPAINPGLSVSRVGGAAQIKAIKSVSGNLRLDLASYRELESFTQFGSDLDATTKRKLERGGRTVEVLKQGLHDAFQVIDQVVILYALIHGYIDDIDIKEIQSFEEGLIKFTEVSNEGKEVKKIIEKTNKLPKNDEIDKLLKAYMSGR